MRSVSALWVLASALALGGCADPEEGDVYRAEVGDVLFQSSTRTPLGGAVAAVTHSPITHCGIVSSNAAGLVVIEALSRVTATPIDVWLRRGDGEAFIACRFREPYRSRIPAIADQAEASLGCDYDLRFLFGNADYYCSELVFAAFQNVTGEELGTVTTLAELDWEPYTELILAFEGRIPLERQIITPQALADAAQMAVVFRRGI